MEDKERSQNERKNTSRFTRNASRKLAFALLSGILLFCSFPPFECSLFAWIALLPLLYLCFHAEPGRAFRYGLLAGTVSWLAGIFWLTRVSFIGWILVSLYCALYCALFALIVSWWFRRRLCSALGGHDVLNNLTLLLGVPALWVGLEYARAHLGTGFPWNLLGVSQYRYADLIQCAEWGGVYLVSYLVVMGNTAGALLVFSLGECSGGKRRSAEFTLAAALLLICLALFYGRWRQNQPAGRLVTMQAAAVQLNVPQQYKWSEEWASAIYRRLQEATENSCRPPVPDLVVWPETALPDFMRRSAPSRESVRDHLRHGVPLLAGSMDYDVSPDKTNYYNSSFLFLPGGPEPQIYNKRHLVLFGEYVPFARYFPFLRAIAQVEEDFTPGAGNVVFRLAGGRYPFSVLICFEDTLPYLARECVRAGARLLINQTNDAWFDPSWASRQHMAHCVFRCVENRVACLRAGNTGLTCLIDRFGVIRSALRPLGRAPRAPEVLRAEVAFAPEEMPLTFYTRHGDVFALACLAFSLPFFIGILLYFRPKQ